MNDASVLQTNTIHGVRIQSEVTAEMLAAGFYNSLTLLSCELAGRSYGGGVLKLEPTEAESLLIPSLAADVAELLPVVDAAVRRRDLTAAVDLVDQILLVRGLGLRPEEIELLRSGRQLLRGRRKRRAVKPVS